MIANIVREARARLHLTQAEVAQRAGVSRKAIVELENGIGRLPLLQTVLTVLDARVAGLPAGSTLPDRVRTARQRRGWSIEILSAKAGLSKGAVVRLEAGQARISTLEAVLRVLAPQVRGRRPDVREWNSKRDSRFTPPSLLDAVVSVFGAIALDPCGDPASPVVAERYFYESDDGLVQSWACEGAVFVNPPYSLGAAFTKKAFGEWSRGACSPVILLLRAITNGPTFHNVVVPNADTFFLKDRIEFWGEDGRGKGGRAPFGCMIVTFGATQAQVVQLQAGIDCAHLAPSRSAFQQRELIWIEGTAEPVMEEAI